MAKVEGGGLPIPEAYEIAVVPGDGIGPEVCEATLEVLGAAFGGAPPLRVTAHEAGAACYRRGGEAFPAATLAACEAAHAVLHGAAGLPEVRYPDGTEAGQDFSMKIRTGLDLYANIRPIRLLPGAPRRLAGKQPGDIRFTIVRENTEGLYAARGGGNVLRGDLATDTLVVTRAGIERIARMAAKLALAGEGAPADGVRRVTVVDKANVLRSYAYFRQVADAVLAETPEIEVEHVIVDAMALHLVERPERFDVVLCENLLGDILSDLGAAIMGGLGLAPSAEIGEAHGYFQGSHGSAPDIAGRGLANPIACVLSAAMMLDWLAERHGDPRLAEAAARIRGATERVLADGRALTPDLGGGASTMDCAAAIAAVAAP